MNLILIFLLIFNFIIVEIYSASVCDKITFVTRAQWNARKAETVIPTMTTPVHHVFIHHTEAPDQCHNQSACITAVKGIQNFHIDTRKWYDIGYNFLMGGDERIYEGRGWTEVGAHTLGMNDKSVALSLIGNFEAVDPPKFMLDLAQNWIECGIEMGIIAKDYELHGHRDQTCTSCPGQHLYDIIKHWKQFKGGKLSTYVCNK